MVSVTKKLVNQLVIIVLALALLFGIYTIVHRHNSHKQVDANTSLVNMLSKSKSIDDRRSLTSAYLATNNYAAAESTQKQVAQQTDDVNDYLGLLNICTVRAVPDKQSCINFAVSKIKPTINSLSFFQVYSTASELDDAGYKKDAVVFYQRAYDIYPAQPPDAYTKTKDQIKQRLTQLNA